MPTIKHNGLEIEYEERGEGEPVVLIHGGVVGAFYWEPLVDAMLEVSERRVITYNRRGFGRSSAGTDTVTFAAEAEDLKCLLDSLGLERTHLVGHSYGGAIGITLAIDRPEAVQSLTLMEAYPVFLLPSGAAFGRQVVQSFALWPSEGAAAAINSFLRTVGGPNYPPLAPGWLEQIIADVSSGRKEGSDLREWNPTPDQLGRVTMPVLLVLGGESHTVSPVFEEGHALEKTWFPHAEEFVLPRATHALHNMNPHDLADALNAFYARNPVATQASSGES